MTRSVTECRAGSARARVRATAVVCSVAPHDADGLDFLAWMGQDNVEEFGLALEGAGGCVPTPSNSLLRWARPNHGDAAAGNRPQLGQIQGPVSLWQGGEDLMVPFSHGQWLAEHIPASRRTSRPAGGTCPINVG